MMFHQILPCTDAIIFLTDCSQALKASETPFLKSNFTKSMKDKLIIVFNHSDSLESLDKLMEIKKYSLNTLSKVWDGNINEKHLFDNFYFTCLDVEALKKVNTSLQNELSTQLENLIFRLNSMVSLKKFYQDQKKTRNITLELLDSRDATLSKIQNLQTLKEKGAVSWDGLKFRLEKQIVAINEFDKKTFQFKEELNSYLEKSREALYSNLRGQLNNPTVASGFTQNIEYMMKGAIKNYIAESLGMFNELSNKYISSAIEVPTFSNPGHLETLNFDFSATSNVGIEQQQVHFRASAIGMRSHTMAGAGAAILGLTLGPIAAIVGSMCLMAMSSHEMESLPKEIKAGAEQATEEVLKQVHPILDEFTREMFKNSDKVIAAAADELSRCVSKIQWEIIELSEIKVDEEQIDFLKNELGIIINKLTALATGDHLEKV